MSNLLRPLGLQPTRLLCPWDFPDKNTGVGYISFTRGSSWPRERIWVSCVAGIFFTAEPPRKLHFIHSRVWFLDWKDSLEKGMATHPLQYSCLENSMDRGAWQAIVHGVITEQLTHIHIQYIYICQSPSPKSSQTPFPFFVHTFVLYICVAISALQISSSVPFF